MPDVDLDESLQGVQPKGFFDLTQAYGTAAKNAEEKGDTRAGKIYRSVAILCSFQPQFDNPTEPYGPAGIMDGRRSAIPNDLTDGDLNIVSALKLKTKEPLLRARLGDILWVRRHDHVAAKEASKDYVTAGKGFLNKENWIHGIQQFQRAMQLGHRLGRNNEPWLDAESATIKALTSPLAATEPFYAAHFLRILAQMNAGNADDLAALARQHAEKALAAGQPGRARDYREYEADLWKRAKNKGNESMARLETAKTYEIEADNWIKGDKPSYFAASGSLAKGVEALRRSGGDPAQVEQLRNKLMLYQAKSVAEMQTLEHQMDISDPVKHAMEIVSVPDFREALRLLAFSVPLVKQKDLREAVLKQGVWQSIIDTSLIDSAGRVTKHLGTIWGDRTEQEVSIENHMFRHAAEIDWSLRAQAFIEPARRTIWAKNIPRESDFNFLVFDNPFVPPGHEGIVRRGLYYGLQGDLLLATHLLVPQIENSIRYVLEQRGIDVSNLESDLTQPVKLLGPLLWLPETKRVFGEDLWFELRGLLIEQTGYSLRNNAAHGFLTEGQFYGPESLNAWWLVLRLCYTPLIQVPA